jgi:predicted Zn-dependent peptidase
VSPEVARLGNGLVVTSFAMPEVETLSLGVFVGTGSRGESLPQHGVAHFLEHMAFKGTARRSARDIAEEIEAVGGDLNAATGLDQTAYYARVMGKDFELALDILSDILLNPRFDEMELATEREVILQEIAASLDSPEETVFDLAQDAAYPEQPLGRPILGTASSVARFTRGDLDRYLEAHYHAPNMVVVAAGAVDHAALVAAAEARLAGLPSSPAPQPAPARYGGGIRRSSKAFEQSHLVLGFEAPAYHDAAYFPVQMLAGALGGGMSSRLFQEVRERRGLCYSIYAFAHGISDTGSFGVYAATAPERSGELFAVIREEILRAAESGFQAVELERVKAQAKMGLLAGLESSSARVEQLGRHILVYGRPLSKAELIDRIEAVSLDDLQRQAERLLASPLSLATVGPIPNPARFEAIAAQFNIPPGKAA